MHSVLKARLVARKAPTTCNIPHRMGDQISVQALAFIGKVSLSASTPIAIIHALESRAVRAAIASDELPLAFLVRLNSMNLLGRRPSGATKEFEWTKVCGAATIRSQNRCDRSMLPDLG